MRGCLRQFPDLKLDNRLDEEKKIGFVSSAPADAAVPELEYAVAFEGSPEDRLPAQPEDLKCIVTQGNSTLVAPKDHGELLSPDRLTNREPPGEASGDIKVLIVNEFASIEDAKQKIKVWRQDCNDQTPHSALGHLTPNEFAMQGPEIALETAILQSKSVGNRDNLRIHL